MTHNDDQAIRDALGVEPFEAFEEDGFFKQMFDTFKGRNGWVAVLSFVYTLVFSGVMIYAAYRFFTDEAFESTVFWGIIMVHMAVFVGLLKMWYFMKMDRNTSLREVKRLELQVATLNARDAS